MPRRISGMAARWYLKYGEESWRGQIEAGLLTVSRVGCPILGAGSLIFLLM